MAVMPCLQILKGLIASQELISFLDNRELRAHFFAFCILSKYAGTLVVAFPYCLYSLSAKPKLKRPAQILLQILKPASLL